MASLQQAEGPVPFDRVPNNQPSSVGVSTLPNTDPAPVLGNGSVTQGASPANDAAQSAESQKAAYMRQYAQIDQLIKTADPEAVRQAVRDNWQRCVAGPEYHVSFLLNTALHEAHGAAIDRAVHDFGQKMVRSAKHNIIRHFTTEDLDELAELIYSKASNRYHDFGLARRLETIPARSLVNALARAERLGYDVQDIVEEKSARGQEQVIPTLPQKGNFSNNSSGRSTPVAQAPAVQAPAVQAPAVQAPMAPMTSRPAPTQPSFKVQPPLPLPGTPGQIVNCHKCNRPCSGAPALKYHLLKSACGVVTDMTRFDRDICPHCGCQFGTTTGAAYHQKSNVCGLYSQQTHQAMLSLLAARAAQAANSIRDGATQSPSVPATVARPPPATPHQPSPRPNTTPSSEMDPYAGLDPVSRAKFEEEMKSAEDHYGQLMKAAMALAEPQQSHELKRLKNSYNTKQSMTRKKYGIRLRERRSKQQIAAERTRLFGTPDGPSLSGRDGAAKRPASSSGASMPPSATPRLSLSQMQGGLAGSSATAELTDPTMSGTATQPQHTIPQMRGTSDDPMEVDGPDTSSDDGDIPA